MAQQIKVILSTTFRGYAAVLPQSFVASVAITANMHLLFVLLLSVNLE